MTEEHDSDRDRRASDIPLDLDRERETFVKSFFRQGVEFTERLLGENTVLREQMGELSRHNARLRAQVASDDAIRDLLKTIEKLEREKEHLLDRSNALERTHRLEEGRSEELEHELNDLANLYIASYQLHTSLSPRRVIRQLKDMLCQLVGARAVVFYAVNTGQEVVPIGTEGIEADGLEKLVVGEGPVGEACLTGLLYMRDDVQPGTPSSPVAVVPMMVEGRPVGAISIVSMLPQKRGWVSVDRELFKLLGAHAGTALIAANVYARIHDPIEALDGIIENLLRRTPSQFSPPGEE